MYNVFSVYDAALSAYMQPFFLRSKGEAVRSFTDAIADPKMPFHAHPEDYTLFLIGAWDDVRGVMVSPVAPERIISALECVKV